MPRPTDLTKEHLSVWMKVYQENYKTNGGHWREFNLEEWLSGCYLNMKLLEMKCSPDRAEKICFAMGQRQAMYDGDCWDITNQIIENYKSGTWEEPGENLAKKLFEEKFGTNPDPKAVLRWLRGRPGTDQGKLNAFMFKTLMEEKVVLPPVP